MCLSWLITKASGTLQVRGKQNTLAKMQLPSMVYGVTAAHHVTHVMDFVAASNWHMPPAQKRFQQNLWLCSLLLLHICRFRPLVSGPDKVGNVATPQNPEVLASAEARSQSALQSKLGSQDWHQSVAALYNIDGYIAWRFWCQISTWTSSYIWSTYSLMHRIHLCQLSCMLSHERIIIQWALSGTDILLKLTAFIHVPHLSWLVNTASYF